MTIMLGCSEVLVHSAIKWLLTWIRIRLRRHDVDDFYTTYDFYRFTRIFGPVDTFTVLRQNALSF